MSAPASAQSRLVAENAGTVFSCLLASDGTWPPLLHEGVELTLRTGLGLTAEGNRIVFLESAAGDLNVVAWASARWTESGPEVVEMNSSRPRFEGERPFVKNGRFTLERIELLQQPAAARPSWIQEKGPVIPAKLEGVACELRLLVSEEFAAIRDIFVEAPLQSEEREETRGTGGDSVESDSTRTAAALLSRFPLSVSARELLKRAAERRAGAAAPVRSSGLLLTLLQQGAYDADANLIGASAIFGRLARQRGGEKLAAWIQTQKSGEIAYDAGSTPLSRNVEGIFEFAAKFVAEAGTSDKVLAVRHLVVALLEFQPERGASSAQQALVEAGLDRAELRQAFLESLADAGPEEERGFWGAYVERGRPPIRRRAGFNADLSLGDDQLGIQVDVDAMAALIASVELQPPLSIGLFGNWGSGKSFFMEKLRDALSDLTKSDGAAVNNGGAPKDFWPNIVPIEFNAWHYIDSNLWASLVTHIFERLRQWKQPGEGEKLQLARHKTLENLKLAQEARSDAVKHQAAAEAALEKAHAAQKEASANLNTAASKLAALVAKDIWTTLGKLPADDTKEAREKLKEMGLAADATAESVETVYAQLSEFASSAGRYRALGLTLISGRGAWLGLVALVFSVVVALGAAWAATRFSDRLAPAIALITQVAGIATAGIAWVGSAAKRVRAALEPLERARLKIEARIKVVEEERAKERATLEREIEQQRAALQAATDSVAVADRALQAAQADAVDAFSGRYVTKFIEQRAASADYRKHLGLVALIREDFGRLSTLIIDHNRNRTGAAAEANVGVAGENVAEAVAKAGDLGVNRIVLFIDDLDRCPSDRVVEVLQAIHLLLAFPLFVVVVGVDSRWVTRALLDTHPTLFGRNKDGQKVSQEGVDEALASPGDYLEKIFQIPYRLRDLDPTGCRKLIRELTRSDAVQPAKRVEIPVMPDAQRDAEASPPVGPGNSAGRADDFEPPATKTPAVKTGGEKDLKLEMAPPPPPGVEALRLTDRERDAMSELAPIIGRSPRATKRFVNTYRLLRATDPRLRYDFRGTMLLLATVTGTASVAAKVIRAFDGDNAGNGIMDDVWKSMLDGCENVSEAERFKAFFTGENAGEWRALPVSSLRAAWERVSQFSFVDLDEPEVAPATVGFVIPSRSGRGAAES